MTFLQKVTLATLLLGIANLGFCQDKMTLDTAINSHKQNLPEKGISSAESKASWDSVGHFADFSSGSNSVEMVYTPLWTSPIANGSGSGNFTLTDSFRNYDEIVVIAGYSGKSYIQHFRFTPREYDEAVQMWGQAAIWERERELVSGRFLSDNKTFSRMISTGYIYKIYGVSFE